MEYTLIFIIIIMLFIKCDENINENSIELCKISDEIIHIDYAESVHAITHINKKISNDTLILYMKAALWKQQKDYNIKIGKNIRFIKVGKKIFEVKNIQPCSHRTSGNETTSLQCLLGI